MIHRTVASWHDWNYGLLELVCGVCCSSVPPALKKKNQIYETDFTIDMPLLDMLALVVVWETDRAEA